MSYEILGLAYSRIGDFLIDRFQNQDARIFLYAEAEPGVMGEGVYLDRGVDILYIDYDSDLTDLLFEAWEAEVPDKRWSSMEFFIRKKRFSATFTYVKFKEFDPEREAGALRRAFGDKPIFYPGPSFEERYEALDPKNFPGDF